MHLIFAHENADFDAVAAMLAAHKLNPDAIPVLARRQNTNVTRFLTVYKSALPFVERDDIKSKKIERVTLVDTSRVPPFKGVKPTTPVHIIDHHPLNRELMPNETFEGDPLGSATALLVEKLQARSITISPLEATLMTLGIYEDTGSLAYRTTTPRDIRAAAWLLEQGAALDTVRRYLEPPLTDEQSEVFEALIKAAEMRRINGYNVVVTATETTHMVDQLNSIAHRVRDTLDPHAVIILVTMPRKTGTITYIVCRSNDDAIDVSQIANVYNGGGHDRAASGRVQNRSASELIPEIWARVETIIRPSVRVADLMSHSARTVNADVPLREIIGWMRRVGHEGYPVVENGRIVGLLTRRDADRAAEHGLESLTVRQIMEAGAVTIAADASIEALEILMAHTGWGQIPVVDADDKMIGIITRTDVIKYWARTHPQTEPPSDLISMDEITTVLGEPIAHLINLIIQHAEKRNNHLIMVGGVVRDLMLQRPSLDIDFVIDGGLSDGTSVGVGRAGIEFAESLVAEYGGSLHTFVPFGTAKWRLSGAKLPIPLKELPDHIDFATARSEFYEQPTALPTVYTGSIKRDLARRDFTINALAIQFTPAGGRLIDAFGGRADLRDKLIRVLHSLSFIDDPTRILRAVRFETRLDFSIEARTNELMQIAFPMLRRITGERLRNELTLLLRESEPEIGFEQLMERGILESIHPDFRIDNLTRFKQMLQSARTTLPPFSITFDPADLGWHLVGLALPDGKQTAVFERLLFGASKLESIMASVRVFKQSATLNDPSAKISRICAILDDVPDIALMAVFVALADSTVARERIQRYAQSWRAVRPISTGETLREMGLKPGRCYGIILERLRAARLDGEIASADDERRLIARWVDEGLCDDRVESGANHD